MCSRVSCRIRVVSILGREGVGLPEGIDGTCLDLSQQSFEFGKCLMNRIEVTQMSGHEQEPSELLQLVLTCYFQHFLPQCIHRQSNYMKC